MQPQNRFDAIAVEVDDYADDAGRGDREPTRYLRDSSRSIISRNNSPDIPFGASINPYRGCEHGCAYCYARPGHEYLGFSAGLDFETRIMVKEEAAELLRRELEKPSWRPQVLAMSGVTDPYQPVERKLEMTRGCLEVLAACRHPVSMITKNSLITRDVDLLGELAKHRAASAAISMTSLRGELSATLEPRAAHPRRRLDAVAKLTAAGVPTSVMVAPVIPGLNDHEVPAIVAAAAEAGAVSVGYIILRLPGPVEPIFRAWLDRFAPDRKGKVLSRLRDLRRGKLNDGRFGSRMRGEGVFADQVRSMFEIARRRHGLETRGRPLSTDAFRRPGRQQLSLFS